MKRLLLSAMMVSMFGPAHAWADEPPKNIVHKVGPGGLRLDGEINRSDPRVQFTLDQGDNTFEHKLACKRYDVSLQAGKRYTISMNATAQRGLDAFLVLKDDQEHALVFDDDGGGNLNARLIFDADKAGTYRIYAAALTGYGTFTLKIVEGAIPKGATGAINAKRVINVVRQGFPAAQANPNDLSRGDTAWEIEWDITNPANSVPKQQKQPSSVLAIRSAKFMFKDSAGKARWFTVLKNLQVGEILVPYDRLEPVFLDVGEHAFHIVPARKEYLGPNCVLPGEILDSADPRLKNRVYKEVHDDGLRWLNQQGKGRRGEKMTIWAVFDGGNYRYLIEYGFRDDGSITCRLGATAHNLFDAHPDQRDVHLHVACWHWDPVLMENGDAPIGGPTSNRALLVRRVPRTPAPTGRFRVDIAAFNANELGQASEGFEDWKAEEFTVLRIESLVRRNSSKKPRYTAYDLVPVRLGTVRNYPAKFAFANHDFWITRRNFKNTKFHEVPLYATWGRPLDKKSMTVWHNAASYHVPRGEDYGPDGSSRNHGAAITTWAEFFLKPVNLFDSTPLYQRQMKGR